MTKFIVRKSVIRHRDLPPVLETECECETRKEAEKIIKTRKDSGRYPNIRYWIEEKGDKPRTE